MKITDTKLPDVKLIEPMVFEDERGYFFESFNHKKFELAIGRKVTFVQDNHSKSGKGVLRGMHYQLPPHAQGKLVRAVQGEVFDVVVDMRKSSPTFGQSICEIISEKNKKQLWIPEGFAHGFLVMSETAEVLYKTTKYYAPNCEQVLNYRDKRTGIVWPNNYPIRVSEKDLLGLNFIEAHFFD